MTQVRTIACKEFGDQLRSGWVVVCLAVWLGAIVLTSFFALVQTGRVEVHGYERTVMSLLNLVQYLVPLLGLLLGHDLVVSEKEGRTLPLMLAAGVPRRKLLLGKLLGAGMILSVPLLLGFIISGLCIGLIARDRQFGPFLTLAASALALGLVFVAVGLCLSVVSKSRVQALVLSLITWGVAVFAFDLVALGVIVQNKAPGAALEIEVACDATHLNTLADPHTAYDSATATQREPAPPTSARVSSWILVNPVDAFRVLNLSRQTGIIISIPAQLSTLGAWLARPLGLSALLFKSHDI